MHLRGFLCRVLIANTASIWWKRVRQRINESIKQVITSKKQYPESTGFPKVVIIWRCSTSRFTDLPFFFRQGRKIRSSKFRAGTRRESTGGLWNRKQVFVSIVKPHNSPLPETPAEIQIPSLLISPTSRVGSLDELSSLAKWPRFAQISGGNSGGVCEEAA